MTDPLNHTTSYTYNAAGQLATVSDPDNGGAALVSNSYDSLGQKVVVQDELGNPTTLTYDAVGNPTGVQDPLGNQTTYVYDARNRLTTLTDPLSHSTVRGYDSGGNRVTYQDALGHVTTTQYDALDRATTVTDPRGAVTTLVYDAAGRNTAVVGNGNGTETGTQLVLTSPSLCRYSVGHAKTSASGTRRATLPRPQSVRRAGTPVRRGRGL